MTNTHYIGSEKNRLETDKLTAYKGYKVVALGSLGDGKASIVSPHYSDRVQAFADTAVCGRGRDKYSSHDFGQCECGFYSYDTPEAVISHWKNACGGFSNHVLAEIAVSGKVVVCEHGYRSSQQRITKLLFPNCWNCNKPGTAIIEHESGYYVAGCTNCLDRYQATDAGISFQKFSEINSLDGFAPLEVSSGKFTPTKVTEFFTGMNPTLYSITRQLDELAGTGDLVALDKAVEYARDLLNKTLDLS